VDTYLRVFESVDEMTAAADAALEKGRVHEMGPARWVGREIDGWKDAMRKAKELWADGVEIIKRLAEEAKANVTSKPVSRKRRTAWSEDGGDEIDMDRLRAGQAAWLECRRQSVSAPQVVSLVIDVTASARVRPEYIMWRGAAALVIADLLESAGFNVEIVAAFRSYKAFRNGNNYFLAYRLKRPDQPLDLATLVNAVSGWFFRTVVFQTMYAERSLPRNNLGQPMRISAEAASEAGCSEAPIIIDNVWTQDDAAQLV
jgi:hypothetical protein